MGDINNPYENNNQEPNANVDQPQNQQPNVNPEQPQNPQPTYQQPQYGGQSQSQQSYQQPPQYQSNYSQQPAPNKMNPLALVSLICGGVSFLFSCCLWYVVWAPSIVGIVLGVLAMKKNKEMNVDNKSDKTMSIIGIILSSVALLIIIVLAIFAIFIAASGDSLMDYLNSNGYNY